MAIAIENTRTQDNKSWDVAIDIHVKSHTHNERKVRMTWRMPLMGFAAQPFLQTRSICINQMRQSMRWRHALFKPPNGSAAIIRIRTLSFQKKKKPLQVPCRVVFSADSWCTNRHVLNGHISCRIYIGVGFLTPTHLPINNTNLTSKETNKIYL